MWPTASNHSGKGHITHVCSTATPPTSPLRHDAANRRQAYNRSSPASCERVIDEVRYCRRQRRSEMLVDFTM